MFSILSFVDKKHVSVSGKVTSVPQRVLILDQEGKFKKNITIDSTKPSLEKPELPKPEKPLVPIKFPDQCTVVM